MGEETTWFDLLPGVKNLELFAKHYLARTDAGVATFPSAFSLTHVFGLLVVLLFVIAGSVALREDLSQLVRLERRFSPNGISGPEHAQLLRRSNALAKDIRIASRDHNGRRGDTASWESGSINGQWVPDARFAGLHPGDRFNGDARIGQHATARMVNLPAEYRGQYVDDARVYYGYDNGRVYQIDRQSQMILALLDIAR